MTDAAIRLWGRDVAAVTWVEDRQIGVFQYQPDFVGSQIELAPLMMPLSLAPYSFPALSRESFKGLPGMLADSLPDKFGNRLIDAWLARQGRTPASFNPVERLCYIGERGMGALEFHPVIGSNAKAGRPLEVENLVALANNVLAERLDLRGHLSGEDDTDALKDILRVGTSAGGARAKAILAFNPDTGEFRSGQVKAGSGFEYWLMKFDGVSGNRDKELSDPMGFGRIEYAYFLMARAAGIDIADCRLHEEGGRAHFMTRRFDRTATGQKRHMQSLAALMHYDFNSAGSYSYEQAIQTIDRLDLAMADRLQQVRRAFFNILFRNQDDHVKNIAFLMDQAGRWTLSPAFDVSYSYNPDGEWTSRHQMSLNGKTDGFDRTDLLQFARFAGLKTGPAKRMVDHLLSVGRNWRLFAAQAEVDDQTAARIEKTFRTV